MFDELEFVYSVNDVAQVNHLQDATGTMRTMCGLSMGDGSWRVNLHDNNVNLCVLCLAHLPDNIIIQFFHMLRNNLRSMIHKRR